MRNLLLKIFFTFAFILNLGISSSGLGITSVVYDNSGSILTINSQDNEEYVLDTALKLHVVSQENKAYFDIPNAILKCSKQSINIKSDEINEIIVSQFSTDPNIVRVVFYYNSGFNPYNIQLKKISNTIILKFKNTTISNYYFQTVFDELKKSDFYEPISIQDKLTRPKNDLYNQINSSFGIVNISDDDDYIYNDKDLLLKSNYYINSINFKDNLPIISGIGTYTISKPFYLSNPDRVVIDLPNAIVNPAIRNKDVVYNPNDDSIKIGQFDKNTARIVITTKTPEKYLPVFYPDSQKLIFTNNQVHSSGLQASDLRSSALEKTDTSNYGAKFVFTKPVVWGINRTSKLFDIYLYNVDNCQESDIKNTFKNSPFSDMKIADLPNIGVKISFNITDIENISVSMGSDGKTLRIKEKLSKSYSKPKNETTTIISVQPILPSKIAGKKYVVIDAGHGGSDVGATRNNIYEKDITLDIAQRVEKLLVKKGYIVQMTRTSDKTVSLQERVEFSEGVLADIFVSIHVNSSNSENPSGLETHYYKDNSLMLAKFVHASLLNNISANDRGLFKSKFYVINHTTAPAILVETGFISNPTERAQLLTENRKNATAKAIAEGIDEYFKQ